MKFRSITFGFLLIVAALLPGCGYFSRLLLMQDPLTAEEHNNLGVAYEKEGKYELALREYRRALDKDSSLVVPLVNIGNVYLKQRDYSNAESYYLKAIKKDEKNIEAANNLASLYIKLGKNYEEGLRYLTRAVPSVEDAPAYALDTLGVLYLKRGDREKAREMLVMACKRAGGDEVLLQEIEAHIRELGDQGCPVE